MKNDDITVGAGSEQRCTTNKPERYFFRASAADFKKISGNPIAYWISESVRQAFYDGDSFGEISTPKQGLATGCNELFLREWHEVSNHEIGFEVASRVDALKYGHRWFPYNKGGEWRKWYGNYEYVVDWEGDGLRIRNFKDRDGKVRSRPQNMDYYFQEGITWADITTNSFAARHAAPGFIFDVKGSSGFPKAKDLKSVMGLMNSKLMHGFMLILNPTSTFQVGDVARVPYMHLGERASNVANNVEKLIALGKQDWDSSETSWHFSVNPMIKASISQKRLSTISVSIVLQWAETINEMQRLEEENNRIFIEAYGLQDELTPEVPLKEITLTCNPHYRYGGDKTEEELEALLLADTMREFLSYATGCMFGRYSLDKPGLILANQGDTLTEYLQQVPEPSFMPNQDNVIPILDGDWFTDDITERFRQFLRVTFGEAHYEENLVFIEAALGKDIRKYFLKDFYNDHVRRYKKRPIYWLFSSPKGSFNALIYLHRYRPDTASVVLQYLRDFRKKLAARLDYLQQVGISPSASQSEKTRAQKEIDTIKKQLLELDDYERDTLYPLATAQIALDLDDGVKVNYLKLGPALKKIVGLDAKGED
ncbi:MAG: BREX-1 system adenine-specific DNA-methyltransferase PglX [Acidithiobacillus sp.]